jgi:hypothetical protein
MKLKMSQNNVLSRKVTEVVKMTQLDILLSYTAPRGTVTHRGHVVLLRQCSTGSYGHVIIRGNVTHPVGVWWVNIPGKMEQDNINFNKTNYV